MKFTQRRNDGIARPSGWSSTQGGMSWYHIIPYSVLSSVWNRLVDQHVLTELPEARVAIRQYLSLCNREIADLDNKIDRIRAENASQKRASHNPLPKLEIPEQIELQTAAVWPPWNVVEGPSNRSDDPGDRYIDRFTMGLDPQEVRRMDTVESLFGKFQEFLRPDHTGSAELDALIAAIRTARIYLSGALPIRYRPDMWVQDSDGRWRKRRFTV